MQLTWFDAVIAGVLIFATIRGAVKGLVWQLAWIVAILLSFAFSETASLAIAGAIPLEPPANRWVAMFILYVAAALVSFLAARRMKEWVEKQKFEELDRHFGAILGFVKGAILSLVLVFFSVTLSNRIRDTALKSYTGFGAVIVMDQLHPVMPAELHDALHPYIHSLDEAAGSEHRHGHDHDHDHDREQGTGGPKVPRPVDPVVPSPEKIATVEPGSPTFDSAANGAAFGAMNETDSERERRLLLERIASQYAVFPDAEQSVMDEIELRFVGLPDSIVMAVMKDWNADLFGLRPDPDPGTNIKTILSVRIERQLKSAGIDPRTLESANRDRGTNPKR